MSEDTPTTNDIRRAWVAAALAGQTNELVAKAARNRAVEGFDRWLGEFDAIKEALEAVRTIHMPIQALNVRANRVQHVCVGCGTDDGNWQPYPCPTIRMINDTLGNGQ